MSDSRIKRVKSTDKRRKFSEPEFKSRRKQSSNDKIEDMEEEKEGVETERINVVLHYAFPGKSETESELFKDVPVRYNDKNEIILHSIVDNLKSRGAAFIYENYISYYNEDLKLWVNCGCDPISKGIAIIKEDVIAEGKVNQHIKIKCTVSNKTSVPAGQDAPSRKYSRHREESKNKAVKRTKERKISEIVEKVYEWRRLHQGDGSGKPGISLDEAATLVGISKKSLDDYLSQIR
eukprot:TRINITY_DN3294_c0_g1_i3.p1 TRINITY_DN3294_c0_g1~~TRINITY_DN3294_c0_g1_i3.p1  ORF type:complete len:235 (+),score=46.43 TRINITY_DN3294_c0_g1_i3:129-833(+)